MAMSEFLAIGIYFSFLFFYASRRKKQKITQKDFVIGNRSLNQWKTALSAHASDMSNWLFMAYPGAVFIRGGAHIWVAIGLILMMWINWTVVAPKMRIETEKEESVTITGFFEQKLKKHWPFGRMVTSGFLFLFYTIYVAATLQGMGILMKTLFPFSYFTGILIGIFLILPYVLMGGYATLARVDLFQGIFLLAVIIFVPCFVIVDLGGMQNFISSIYEKGQSFSLISLKNPLALWKDLLLMLGWGLGYFGQPHILTKFMGLKDPGQMQQCRNIGMSWQILSLLAATSVGFVGIAIFDHLADPEQVFIEIIKKYFPPFLIGIFLCAIIAAIINAVSSMLLVLSTTIAEDFYKRFLRKNASEKQQLFVTRLAGGMAAIFATGVALLKFATMDQLVYYAWSGLGATFGPLVIASLYFPYFTNKGAWIGMLVGGGCVAIWPLFGWNFPALVIAFPLSLVSIYFISKKEYIEELNMQ